MDLFDGMKKAFEHIKNGELSKALDVINSLVEKFGDIDQLLYLKGVVLVDMEKYGDAVETFKKSESLGIEPTKNFLSYYGYSLFAVGKFDEAVEKFERALDIEDDPNIRALLVLSLSSAKKYDRACEELKILKEKYRDFSRIDILEKELAGKC